MKEVPDFRVSETGLSYTGGGEITRKLIIT